MRVGGFLSFLLHLAILLLILFGLPDLFKQEEVAAPVAVQLASLADITAQPNPKQTPPIPVVKQETPPPPAPTPPIPPTPPVEQPAETPPPPEPTPPPPEPTPPAPQPVVVTPPPEPIPIPDQQPTPPPPQEAKVEVPPAPKLRPANLKPSKLPKPAQPTQDFNALLKNVEKMKTTSPDTQQPPQPDTPAQPAPSVSDLSAPQMTSSEIDAVRSQIRGCWYLDPGKKGADEMVVDVQVTLAQDGSVQTANVVDLARMADGYYRAAAEAAVRAVKKCSPLHMPAGKYETWKLTTFHFNPGGMLSQ